MFSVSEMMILLHQRQQNPNADITHTDEEHTCTTCGTQFQGRYCPQCGMDSTDTRFSLKAVWNNFIALFDFADRSVPRTVMDLFWRPGYLIADYLGGRRRLYFPPIKLVIVMTFFFAITVQLLIAFGVKIQDMSIWEAGNVIESAEPKGLWHDLGSTGVTVASFMQKIREWSDSNRAYSLMAQSLFWVLSLWLMMRIHQRKAWRKFNLAEVFMGEMYVVSQLQILTIIYMCISAVVSSDRTISATLPLWLSTIIRVIDYMQLYRRGFWGTIWRVVVAYGVIIFSILSVVILVVSVVGLWGTLKG